jgi:hypothetical protein
MRFLVHNYIEPEQRVLTKLASCLAQLERELDGGLLSVTGGT